MKEAMKRLLYLAAALLAVSCAREVIPEPVNQEENQEVKTYTVTLKASFDPETRLDFSPEDGVATWKETDKIAVFSEKGALIEGSITEMDNSQPTFTFTVKEGDAIKVGATAYYPASIAVADNPNQIVLPATFDDLSVSRQTIPMKAVVTEGEIALPFQHLASIVYVNAPTSTPSYPGTGREPKNVLFSVSEGNITGTFTVGEDGNLTAAGNNGKTVQVPWRFGDPYYFVLPAATYDKGFSLSIISADGFTFYRKNRSSAYTAVRAHMLNMPAFDPQCKVFYLTSTATEWSDSEPLARMIQTGENSFLGALYSCKGSKEEWDLGLRILQGYNLGTHWNNVIGGIENSNIATYGENVGNFNGSPAGVYKVSITLYENNWRYTSEKVGNENWDHQEQGGGLTLVGSFNDSWENPERGISLVQKVGHNWYAQIVVSGSSMIQPDTSYEWKIRRNDGWTVNWGRDPDQSYGNISSSQLYSYLQVKDEQHSSTPNCTLKLSAGTYEIFFNDATGWIMFVKK